MDRRADPRGGLLLRERFLPELGQVRCCALPRVEGKGRRKQNPMAPMTALVPTGPEQSPAYAPPILPVPLHLPNRLTPAGPSGISRGTPRTPGRSEPFLLMEELILSYPQSPLFSRPSLTSVIPTLEDEPLLLPEKPVLLSYRSLPVPTLLELSSECDEFLESKALFSLMSR